MKPDYNWKKYLRSNWVRLNHSRILTRILYAIMKNSHFSLTLWGLPGSGKSTLSRWLSYQIYGDWDMSYLARIQNRDEFMSAIDHFKDDKRFRINYEGQVLKRLPHADIDDKGTLFPSSVGQTKEMSMWHEWWQTRRSDVASMAGSSPMTDDVRKRLRIGCDAEIVCYSSFGSRIQYYGKYYEFEYHSKWHDPDKAHLSKRYVCPVYWPQLPREQIGKELLKRGQLADMLRDRARTSGSLEDKAKVLVFDKDVGLMNMQREIVEVIRDKSRSRGSIDTIALNDSYSVRFNVKRDSDWMYLQLKQLERLGVIRHKTNGQSRGWVELTELGMSTSDMIRGQEQTPDYDLGRESKKGNHEQPPISVD